MDQFLYLGETLWRVDRTSGALDRERYLGERTHVPRGPHLPGDWFVLHVRYDSIDRRWALVAVESLPVGATFPAGEPGTGTHRRRRRLGEVTGLFRRTDGRRRPVVGRLPARRETELAPAHGHLTVPTD
ncbi:MAG: hypothetical protein E6G08_12145 [Actinobacteria bacterium]|nr:MAG: hypothetical protein E6G08_12145 [Actinomycetota bacterium]